MSLFRKTVSTRCSGEKNPQCPNFINKTPLPAHKRHCPDPNCGSSVIEDTVPNVPAIAALVSALVVSAGGIVYLVWQNLGTTVTESPTPTAPTATPTPTVEASPTESPETPAIEPSASASPTPTQTPVPPEKLPPPQPTVEEIKNAISKLQTMNPNEVLEFPMEEDKNYRLIGYKNANDDLLGWNVLEVENFLQESLKNEGKYSKASKISLIVREQSTNKQIVTDPISKNELLGRFVRALSVM